jgi:hypothetical protein
MDVERRARQGGRAVRDEWTGKFDGKDYSVTGDPRSDMRSYRKIDDHTLELTVKNRQRGHGRFHRDLGRRHEPHRHPDDE